MIQQEKWPVAHKHEVTYYTQSLLLDMCMGVMIDE